MLTKKQLKKIEEIIKSRFLGLQYEMFGDRALTKEEIELLKRMGLLRSNVRNFTGDAYTVGKVAAVVGPAAASMSYEETMNKAKEMLPKFTRVESSAIDWAATHSGQYITKLSDDMVREVTTAVSRSAKTALRAVQDGVVDSLKTRKTYSELATSLRDAIDNRSRDWDRVAFTEMNDSIQNGIASEIRSNSPEKGDTLVFKRPSGDACKHCKRLYLEADGVTPKVFKLKDLEESNIGKKVADWQPTIGPVHPWCQCQLHVIPEGYNFVKYEDEGVVKLEYTGETASLSKSFFKSEAHDHDDDCTCEY